MEQKIVMPKVQKMRDNFLVNLEKAKDLLKIQGTKGNWDQDAYMFGMYNGMELIVAMMEEREAKFKDAPEEWVEKNEA